jgi:iron complex transport system permease protein
LTGGSDRPPPLGAVPLPVCLGSLAVILAGALVLAAGIGAVDVPVSVTWQIVTDHLLGRSTAAVGPVRDQIIWSFRIPRALMAALCGAGLSVCGAILQALANNPLADSYMLGISSGASFGAVLVIGYGSAAAGGLGASTAAFAGAVLAMVLVFTLGQRGGRIGPARLVLSEVAVAYMFLALTSYVQIHSSPENLAAMTFWLLGSVAGATWGDLHLAGPVIAIMLIALSLPGRHLNALVSGEETAIALGVNVRRLRFLLLAGTSLTTGVLVAEAGGVGFVGLLIPHLVRLTFGIDHRRLLPLSAFVGAIYLVLVDLLSRFIDRPNEMPLGIFTAAVGAPFLVWLMRRSRTTTFT